VRAGGEERRSAQRGLAAQSSAGAELS
jgi:hypothetical protein